MHLLFEPANPTPGKFCGRCLCTNTYDQIYISQYFFVRIKGMQQPNHASTGDWLKQKHKKRSKQKLWNLHLLEYYEMFKIRHGIMI